MALTALSRKAAAVACWAPLVATGGLSPDCRNGRANGDVPVSQPLLRDAAL